MIQFKKLVEAINDAAEIANATLANSEDQVINDFFDKDEETGNFTAKTVTINYPNTTPEGKLEKIKIDVPLITIVPISSASIDELKFTTNLDIALEKDELMVSFSPQSPEPSGLGKGLGTKKKQPTALLELVIKPQEKTQGLNKLIEGYEKSLRAQIPG